MAKNEPLAPEEKARYGGMRSTATDSPYIRSCRFDLQGERGDVFLNGVTAYG